MMMALNSEIEFEEKVSEVASICAPSPMNGV